MTLRTTVGVAHGLAHDRLFTTHTPIPALIADVSFVTLTLLVAQTYAART